MKYPLCDVCLTTGKLTIASWRKKVISGPQVIRFEICTAHKGLKHTYQQALEVATLAAKTGDDLLYGRTNPTEVTR